MYSGTDPIAGTPTSAPTTGGLPAWTGMGLNVVGFPSGSSESVDWAALAQQWIIMKEAAPPSQSAMPVQPVHAPNTLESSNTAVDMVVENITDSQNNVPVPPAPTISPAPAQWNWNMPPPNWTAPPASSFGAPGLLQPPKPPPLLPTPQQQQQAYNNYNQGFVPNWNASTGGLTMDGAPMQAKIIRPHNKRFSKVNVPVPAPAKQPLPSLLTPQPLIPNAPPPPLIHHPHHQPISNFHHTASIPHHHGSSSPSTQSVPIALPTLDAVKRKQLPAWIRDGLEKMERDKQRQMEKLERDRQRALIAPNEYDIVLGGRMESLLTNTGIVPSKFNDDMEENGNDVDNSRQHAEDSEDDESSEKIPQAISHEELMITVRRKMTEILLKVTNEGIRAACTEELQRILRKRQRSSASKAAVIGGGLVAAAAAGASAAKLVGTLGGLAAYADYSDDSSSGSESDEDDDDGQKRSELDAAAASVSDGDSDCQLQETIRRRKAEFSKTEREIEQRLAGGKSRNTCERSSSSTASSSNKSRSSSQDSRSSGSSAVDIVATNDGTRSAAELVVQPTADNAQVDATQRGSVDALAGDDKRHRSMRRSRTKTPTKEGDNCVKNDKSKRRTSTNSNKDKLKEVEMKSEKRRSRTTSATSDSNNKSKSSLSVRHHRSSSRDKRHHRSDRRRSSSSVSSSSRSRSNNHNRHKRRRSDSARLSRSRSHERSSRKCSDQRRSRSTDKSSNRHSRSDRSVRRNAYSSRRRSSRSTSSLSSTSTRRRRRQQDSRQRYNRRSRSLSRSSVYRRRSRRYSRSRSRSRDRSRRK